MRKIFLSLMTALLIFGTSSAAFAANPFYDLPENHWAYNSVVALADAGIVEGYGDGTFRGQRTITRYESAAVLARVMVNFAKDAIKNNPNTNLADVPEGHWAYQYVVLTTNSDVMDEYSGDTFRGNRNLTRYELAEALYNLAVEDNKIKPQNLTSPYTDVPQDHSAYQAVAKLAADEVMEGYGDNTFRGERNLTRYETSLIVVEFVLKYFQ